MTDAVVGWLLGEGSDPAIRWQVLADIVGAPPDVWRDERRRIETEGFGARLLALRDPDGQWAGGAYFPADFDFDGPEAGPGAGQPWTATTHSLSQLRRFGLDPDTEVARSMVELIGRNSRWEEGGQPYWDGEVEPCINGITVANGAYFGVDVTPVVDRLLGERLPDGGWNCEAIHGSTRSSFDTTINVLEGLLAHEVRTGGTAAVTEARAAGEGFLLERHLFRRRSTGEPADPDFLLLRNPSRWQYDVLRALDYLRAAALHDGVRPRGEIDEAVAHVAAKQTDEGTWLLDKIPPGRAWFAIDDGPGAPSRWITMRALRVLAWVS